MRDRLRRVMPIPLLLFLAWRGLLQNRLIAVLLCAAVAGGVAFQIPNDANVRGYDQEIVKHGVVSGSGDVRVRPREGASFHDGDALAASLAARRDVVAAVPAIMLPGALGKDGKLKAALVIGVDSTSPRVPFHVTKGRAVPKGDGHVVLVGTALAARIGASIGDEVQLRVIFGGGSDGVDDGDDVGRYTMTVCGLAGGSFIAPEAIVVDRHFLVEELGESHAASVILVHLSDHFRARAEAASIERDLHQVEARAWADDSPFLASALEGSAAIGWLSRIMVVLAVLMPVLALLYVHVLHGQRQIGIYGAVGLARSEIFAVYLAQAAIVGVVGTLVGCAGGYGLLRWFGAHPIFSSAGFVIRPVVSGSTFTTPALIVLGATLLAGVYPAWRAARIDPARILRSAE